MSYEDTLRSISLDADATLAVYTGVPGQPGSAVPNYGMQYRFVKITGEHQVGLATAAGDPVAGIMQNKPQKAGQAATVGLGAVSNVIAGGAVAAGAAVVPDANGRAVTGSGVWVALAPAAGAGEMIPVLRIGA